MCYCYYFLTKEEVIKYVLISIMCMSFVCGILFISYGCNENIQGGCPTYNIKHGQIKEIIMGKNKIINYIVQYDLFKNNSSSCRLIQTNNGINHFNQYKFNQTIKVLLNKYQSNVECYSQELAYQYWICGTVFFTLFGFFVFTSIMTYCYNLYMFVCVYHPMRKRVPNHIATVASSKSYSPPMATVITLHNLENGLQDMNIAIPVN